MASLAEVVALRDSVGGLTDRALRDLRVLVGQIMAPGVLPPQEVADALASILPNLTYPYAAAIVEVTTEFYMADREAAGMKSRFQPDAAVLPDDARLSALAGYGASVLYEEPAAIGSLLERMSGGLQRALFDVERDTTWELAASDPEPVRYQRMTTSREPCDFCQMLASRGAVYSDKSAGKVVGRGVPVGKHRLAKGVRARGTRSAGEDYHDNDKCIGVAVHPGRAQQMQAKADEHFELYAEARAKVSGSRPRDLVWDEAKAKDGSLKRKYRWEDRDTGEVVTSDDQTQRIVQAMRELRKEQEG